MDAPARARAELHAVKDKIEGIYDSVALLVSELVTNAVKHADAESIELALLAAPGRVRVEVASPGPSFELPAAPEPTIHGGFGFFLVYELADRWGIHENDEMRVWFEMVRS